MKAFARRDSSQQRGFSLLEMAAVLAIIGVVLAGVFAAASLARYRLLVDRASDELNLIVGNMRNLYSGRNISFAALSPLPAGAPTLANFCALTPTLVGQGVFPAEMRAGAGNIVNNPFSGALTGCAVGNVGTAMVALSGASDPVLFVVRFTNLPQDACTDMVVRNSTPGRDTGLRQIVVTGGAATTFTQTGGRLPADAATAAIGCNAPGNYTIDWYYTLGG